MQGAFYVTDVYWLLASLAGAVMAAFVIRELDLLKNVEEPPKASAFGALLGMAGLFVFGHIRGYRIPFSSSMSGDARDYGGDYFMFWLVASVTGGLIICFLRRHREKR